MFRVQSTSVLFCVYSKY